MTTTWFRVQSADRDVQELLDPEMCFTIAWNTGDEQYGISVCYSANELMEYLATKGECIPIGDGDWVIVELTGTEVDTTGHDDETLIEPDSIVSVTPLSEEFLMAVYDMNDAAHAA